MLLMIKLNRRDLTALIPYWGAGGYIEVRESQTSSLFGLVKNKEYTFVKLKPLPDSAMTFERTLFNGIFESGDAVELDSLKDNLYRTMAKARKQLQDEINKSEYYFKSSGAIGILLIVTSVVMIGLWCFRFN
jgi:hypothetical protein